MAEKREFSFGDSSVATGYDQGLVPVLFDPWAVRVVEEHGPWDGRDVLDLATGTGIVAQYLASAVGASGSVLGTDFNGEMLDLARQRCAGLDVTFVESPAHPLEARDASADFIVCQQGFQFFPDKLEAAREMLRVLRPGGTVFVSTWRSPDECQFFGTMCDVLDEVGEAEIAEKMRTPFKMPETVLPESFQGANFEDVDLQRQAMDMTVPGGVDQGVELAYSTPVVPMLRALSDERQREFRSALRKRLIDLSPDGTTMGSMATNVLTAKRSS